MGQGQVVGCTSCSQTGEDGLGWDISHWEECVSVAVSGDKDAPLCSEVTTCVDAFDTLSSSGADDYAGGHAIPPPLEVPARLCSAVEPGAPLGPPKAILGSSAASSAVADLAAGGAAVQKCLKQNRSVQQLLQAFIKAVGSGVGVSLALEGVGVLVVEARLKLHPSPVLELRFNCVERLLPLSHVEDVRIERASHSASGGAWLVRLCLFDDQAFDFVFDGTQDGQREAYYMGGCLRLLVEDAKLQGVEAELQAEGRRGILARNSARVIRASSGLAAPLCSKPLTGPGVRHCHPVGRADLQRLNRDRASSTPESLVTSALPQMS